MPQENMSQQGKFDAVNVVKLMKSFETLCRHSGVHFGKQKESTKQPPNTKRLFFLHPAGVYQVNARPPLQTSNCWHTVHKDS